MNNGQPQESLQQVPSWEESMQALGSLPQLPLDRRKEVIVSLLRNPSPSVRQPALRLGARLFPDEQLLSFLRNGTDDVVRNAGLEMIKIRGGAGFVFAVELLKDSDPDLVLQAILVLDHLKDPRALEPLRRLLNHSDPNVVQSAIVAIGHLGDGRVVPDLLPFLQRDMWLQMAAVQALGDVRSPAAVPVLAELQQDPFLSQFALEALARIGGPEAFGELAVNWIRYPERMEAEAKLGLLAHVLEGLSCTPPPVPGLRPAITSFLGDRNYKIRMNAAACALALGPGLEDRVALEVLAEQAEPSVLPACLHNRSDLVTFLLGARTRISVLWGLFLGSRHPHLVSPELLATAIDRVNLQDAPEPILEALMQWREPALAPALLDLFLRTPASFRSRMVPLLCVNRETLTMELRRQGAIDRTTRLMLSAILNDSAEEAAGEISELPEESRVPLLAQIADCRDVIQRLPWSRWLHESPGIYADLAAEALLKSGLDELLAPLRETLAFHPSGPVVRALGELKDACSVSTLLSLLQARLDQETSPLIPIVLDALGQIGGPQVRRTLREALSGSNPRIARVAYNALAHCATPEDAEIFQQAAGHEDWYVRLACVEALARIGGHDSWFPLTQLTADPAPIVSQRALGVLETLEDKP